MFQEVKSHFETKIEKLTGLHFGLEDDKAKTLEIHWPDKDRTITHIDLIGVINKTIVISKVNGLLENN